MKRLTIFFFLLTIFSIATAQVPGTLSYQGLLLKSSDNTAVADGAHTVLFKFYTAESGGSEDASLTRGPISITTNRGLFTVIIGNGQGTNNAALPSTFGSAERWVGVTPDNGTELSPRVRLTAVPYAYVAQSANSVSASNITTGTLPATVMPTTEKILPGTIMAYASPTPPAAGSGWLLCDGSAVSRTTYNALFLSLGSGTYWGTGDGSTTFNLPDLRGRFLRGVNGDPAAPNSIVDPDYLARTDKSGTVLSNSLSNNVGSYQGDAFQGHNLSIRYDGGTGSSASGRLLTNAGTFSAGNATLQNTLFVGDGTNGTPRISSETRPKNVYVNFIIKY